MRSAIGAACLAAMIAHGTPARAHPHVWVAAKSRIAVDPQKRLLGIGQSWTFDREYSAFATLNLDSRHDGKPDPDKLAELARSQLASLEPYGYFTRAKVNGATVAFDPPRDETLTLADGRLTLAFFLPTKQPPKLRVASIETYDTSFFVAFNLSRASDGATLTGGAPACALNVARPDADAEEGRQIIPDAEAAALANASAVATDFVAHVIVACP